MSSDDSGQWIDPEPEHPDGQPYELTRGGITWGTDVEITEEDVVCMFLLDGKILPMLWADQAFPQAGDMLQPSSIGAKGGELIEAAVRLWQAANLLMIGCKRVGEIDDDEEGHDVPGGTS